MPAAVAIRFRAAVTLQPGALSASIPSGGPFRMKTSSRPIAPRF
jgi:hypothetical protein